MVVNGLPEMRDYHYWLKTHGVYQGTWHGISEYRCFRFSQHGDGHAVVQHRLRMTPPSIDDRPRVAAQPHLDWYPAFGQRVIKRMPDLRDDNALLINKVVTRPLPYNVVLLSVEEFVKEGALTLRIGGSGSSTFANTETRTEWYANNVPNTVPS